APEWFGPAQRGRQLDALSCEVGRTPVVDGQPRGERPAEEDESEPRGGDPQPEAEVGPVADGAEHLEPTPEQGAAGEGDGPAPEPVRGGDDPARGDDDEDTEHGQADRDRLAVP